MGALANLPTALESITCASCGVEFAMPRHLLNTRRDGAGQVFCPSGHTNHWAETKAQRLQRELDAKNTELERARVARVDAECVRDRALARADKAERTLKRTKNGVCPCCKRSFTALRRHMATKHPDFKP